MIEISPESFFKKTTFLNRLAVIYRLSWFSRCSNISKTFYQRNVKKLLVVALASGLFSVYSVPANALELGDKAPNFELVTLAGDTFRLSDYRGKKPVYLVFWATWCPICRAEIPNIKKIHQQIGDQIEVLGINVGFEDTLDKAIAYKKTHQLPYAIAFDENTVITKGYGVVGTPWQVVIDINGIVRYFSNETPEDIADYMEELLKKSG
ncbi:MAG: TlpA disulfide reductase family protein [Oceanospirillaceae bacterium]